MKILLVWLVGAGWAGDGKQADSFEITVCLIPAGNASTFFRGQGVASQILGGAGVKIAWRNCLSAERAIVVILSYDTSPDFHPGALAYALPYERTRIVLFWDRVLAAASPIGVPSLLGHVLAHEIVHMLQGVERHSTSGLMKRRWDHRDYVEMQRKPLRLTDEDIVLIRQGASRFQIAGR